MNNRLFRQKSLQQLSTVEEPRDYPCTVGPRLWMLVSIVVVLVAGSVAYARAVTVKNTVDTVATVGMVEDDEGNSGLMIVLEIPSNVAKAVRSGTRVVIGDEPGELYLVSTDEDGSVTGYVMLDRPTLMEDGTAILEDGTYDATIVLESVPLFGFIA